MSGRIGQKVTGENITIWDDGLDPDGLPVPFDFEGVPKRKVMLLDRGVAAGVVYGSLAAAREREGIHRSCRVPRDVHRLNAHEHLHGRRRLQRGRDDRRDQEGYPGNPA
jgi:hypothetical protein